MKLLRVRNVKARAGATLHRACPSAAKPPKRSTKGITQRTCEPLCSRARSPQFCPTAAPGLHALVDLAPGGLGQGGRTEAHGADAPTKETTNTTAGPAHPVGPFLVGDARDGDDAPWFGRSRASAGVEHSPCQRAAGDRGCRGGAFTNAVIVKQRESGLAKQAPVRAPVTVHKRRARRPALQRGTRAPPAPPDRRSQGEWKSPAQANRRATAHLAVCTTRQRAHPLNPKARGRRALPARKRSAALVCAWRR